MIRKTILLLALLTLCLFASACADGLGDPFPETTVTLINGETLSLPALAEGKQCILLHFWATWCPPCEQEFPLLQSAYEAFSDTVEVVALSVDPADTDEKLIHYADTHNLTFSIGNGAATDLAERYQVTGIPTTLIIDRYGTVCYIASGRMPDEESFLRLMDYYSQEPYPVSLLSPDLPPERIDGTNPSPDQLTETLEAEGLIFSDSLFPFAYPMTCDVTESRTVLTPSIPDGIEGESRIEMTVDAHAGDSLAMTFSMHTLPSLNVIRLSTQEKTLLAFSGDHAWDTAVYTFSEDYAGPLILSFTRFSAGDQEETTFVDSLALYPAGASVPLSTLAPRAAADVLAFASPDADRIVLHGADAFLGSLSDKVTIFLAQENEVHLTALLPDSINPETALFVSTFDNNTTPAASMGVYSVDSAESTGYLVTLLNLYTDASDVKPHAVVLLLRDEHNLSLLLQNLSAAYGNEVTWEKAPDTSPASPGA
ncbi:MAG: TlpA family protein disulfide reductase [Clostridia bacterium]|nr:TlpA family protein disulfide reductase [Clostridia bacterium]